MIKISFRTKVAFILLILSIAPLLINGFFTISNTSQFLEKNARQNLKLLNELVYKEMETFINEAINAIENISKNPILTSLEIPVSQKEEELKKIVSGSPVFSDITLLNPEGKVITSSSFRFYGNWESNYWFLKAKKEKHIVMSDIYAPIEVTEPVISFFVPILNAKNEPYLFIAAQLTLEKIFNLIQRIQVGERGQVFLINQRGEIVIHPYKSLLFEKISGDYPLKEAITKKEGEVIFTYFGEKSIGFFKVFEHFGKYLAPNWQLISTQPREEILTLVKIIRNQILTSLFTLLFFVILISYFLSRYITDPLMKLSLAAQEIAKGNFKVRVNIKTRDELENLASMFNEMVSELEKFYSSLEEIKKNLELQVQAKTIELEALNRSLEEEVQKKTKELQKRVKELETSRIALLNILEDVEEARNAAEAERLKTSAIIFNFADGLLFFDKENKLIICNSQAEFLLDTKKEQILGKTLSQLNEMPLSNNFKLLLNLLDPNLSSHFRTPLTISENLILEVTTTPISLENERLGTLVILHDITREKLVERLKTEFVSLAAHQLRTPLSAIKWSLQLVLSGDAGEISEEQKDLLSKAYEANERTVRLINDLLNVTRIEEGRYLYKLEEKDLVPILNEIVTFYKEHAKKNNITLEAEYPQTLPKVNLDEEKIKLAITNLVDNAVNYTLSGGKVFLKAYAKDDVIEIIVKDTGIGIPKDQQARVFSKFFRGANATKVHTSGTGLGLFITKNIIEAHGGKIWFESEEGKGTTFYVQLPIKK